jgi:hypothetical protein
MKSKEKKEQHIVRIVGFKEGEKEIESTIEILPSYATFFLPDDKELEKSLTDYYNAHRKYLINKMGLVIKEAVMLALLDKEQPKEKKVDMTLLKFKLKEDTITYISDKYFVAITVILLPTILPLIEKGYTSSSIFWTNIGQDHESK